MNGWLLDVNVHDDKAYLLFKENEKRTIIADQFNPSFWIIGKNPDEIAHLCSAHPDIIEAKVEMVKIMISDQHKSPAVKLTVLGTGKMKKVLRDMKKVPGFIEILESVIPHEFRYIYEKNLSFFSQYEVDPKNRGIKMLSRNFPELEIGAAIRKQTRIFLLDANLEQREFTSQKELYDHLRTSKIDVLFSYGTKNIRCPNQLLIDICSDFGADIYSEDEPPKNLSDLLVIGRRRMIRIMELSSLTGAGPGIVSTVSPGRLNTYLHMRAAKDSGFLIPDSKLEIERPKSFRMLRIIDKGGRIFYPDSGVYSNVAKCDFASMYPNIIVNYNISPEMMHCTCENYTLVPEAGWRICNQKKGIIPEGIEEVLRRRLQLKKMMQEEHDPEKRQTYDLRQRALKNILVTCFGYLGFKNFIFSNVECKECVMLFGRDIMLRTKEIAESMGLNVIYGVVDSVFVFGGSEDDYHSFSERVGQEIGIRLEVDCIFRKISFPSADDGSGIANKYYGISRSGDLEARGIAIRHSDACGLIREFQARAIGLLFSDDNFHQNIEKAEHLMNQYSKRIYRRDFPIKDFTITKRITRDLEDYAGNPPHVTAARLLEKPVNSIGFIYTIRGPKPAAHAIREEVHTGKYCDLLKRSFRELVLGIEKSGVSPKLFDYC